MKKNKKIFIAVIFINILLYLLLTNNWVINNLVNNVLLTPEIKSTLKIKEFGEIDINFLTTINVSEITISENGVDLKLKNIRGNLLRNLKQVLFKDFDKIAHITLGEAILKNDEELLIKLSSVHLVNNKKISVEKIEATQDNKKFIFQQINIDNRNDLLSLNIKNGSKISVNNIEIIDDDKKYKFNNLVLNIDDKSNLTINKFLYNKSNTDIITNNIIAEFQINIDDLINNQRINIKDIDIKSDDILFVNKKHNIINYCLGNHFILDNWQSENNFKGNFSCKESILHESSGSKHIFKRIKLDVDGKWQSTKLLYFTSTQHQHNLLPEKISLEANIEDSQIEANISKLVNLNLPKFVSSILSKFDRLSIPRLNFSTDLVLFGNPPNKYYFGMISSSNNMISGTIKYQPFYSYLTCDGEISLPKITKQIISKDRLGFKFIIEEGDLKTNFYF